MPCRCQKKRNPKVKKLMQRRLFEIEQLKIARSMKDKAPSSLKDKQLLDYHKKTHMLYAGNIKRKPINKQFVNSIVDLHNTFVDEMNRRGMKHQTPLKKV
jgi:hypothetical protein